MLYRIENKDSDRVVQLSAAGRHFSLARGEFFTIDVNPVEAERLQQALPVLSVTTTDSAGGEEGVAIENPKPAVDPTPFLHVPTFVQGDRFRSQVPFPRLNTAPDSANEPVLEPPGEMTHDLSKPQTVQAGSNIPVASSPAITELAEDPNVNVEGRPPGTKVGVIDGEGFHQEVTEQPDPNETEEEKAERKAREQQERNEADARRQSTLDTD